MDLGEREAGTADVVGAEEGVVPAGRLRTALQDVPGDHGPREGVQVVGPPAEVGGGRAGDEGRVGDPAGDDDVGPGAQAGGDAGAAEVGVGGEEPVRHGQAVALDMGDGDRHPDPGGQLPYGVGQSGRVEAARVGDDLHAALVGEAEPFFELAQEGGGVALLRVLEAAAAEDQHGQLGEVVAGEDVEGAAGEHLAYGVEAVAVEAGGVADPEGPGGGGAGHRLPSCSARGRRPGPGGPAKAWAMESHWSASCPSAVTARSARWARWVTRRQKSRSGPVTR